MTPFEKWLESYPLIAPEHLDDCVKAAWNAATLAEREACADLAESYLIRETNLCSSAASDCAAAIRARTE